MIRLIATIVAVAFILWLFYLDRDRQLRTSKALWIPTAWLLINGSRAVSEWSLSNQAAASTTHLSEGSPLDVALYAALIGAGVLVLNHRSSQVKRFIQGNFPLLLFFAYCALSIAWSDFPLIAAKRWVKAVGDLVMLLVVLTDQNPLAATRRLFARLAFVLLPLSVLFILQYPALGSFYESSSGVTYYSGVTTQKNTLGQTCMVCGLASLWSFVAAFENRNMPHRVRHLAAHGIILASAVWLIVKADSMTSLSCLALAGAVMIMATQRWVAARPGGINAIVGGTVGLAVFAIFLDSAGSLLHSLGRNATLTGRTAIWKAVLSLHTNPLVGTGFESFWLGSRLQVVWSASDVGILQAHNGYLEIYINLGWIGVILLGGLAVTGYRHALAVFRQDPEAGRLALAFFAAGLIFSLSEAGFRMMNLIWFAFLLAISGIPLGLQSNQGQQALKLPSNKSALKSRFRVLQ
jgi:O-antigen ligase